VIWALPDAVAVAVSVAVWVATSFAVGRWAVSWPDDRLDEAGPLTRIRRWERHGGFWIRHLRVLRWKDRLPEAGAFFAGGRAKTSVGTPTTEHLQDFRRETIRAERVHWLIAASGPLHLLWCRPTVGVGMIVFGVVFDAPFIVIQRTNRGRIERVLRRRRA
jgi:glycosyl-4,4'-diaponeurosporenoate acyltransferase